MDPLMHLLLPLLFLLAIKVDARRALLLAPLAILPDLDALFGLHRALGHSFIPILVVPMAFLAFSYLRRPEWVPAAIVAQFYLASHVVLDLGGVAFLWPIVQEQFYLRMGVTLTADDGLFRTLANRDEVVAQGTLESVAEKAQSLLSKQFAAPVVTERDGKVYMFAQKAPYARFGDAGFAAIETFLLALALVPLLHRRRRSG